MEKLNNYVLMEIFEYFDGSTLKNCMETCSHWSDLIGSSMSTMKKLPLMLDNHRLTDLDQKLEEVRSLKRNYHTLIIDEIHITCIFLPPLRVIAQNIRVLELVTVEQTDASWKTLLKHLKSIESISLVESKHSCSRKMGLVERIKIPTLKSLTFMDSDWSLFESIGETSVEELKIHHNYFYPADVTYFIGFLRIQKMLTSLAVRVQQVSIYKLLQNDETCTFKFHLKRISVNYKNFSDPANASQLIDFLDQHKESLENLETESKLHPTIYEFIFKKLMLKSLLINATYLPRESVTFYNSIRPNRHLTNLVLTGELNSPVAVQGIFSIYRHINKLYINNWSSNIANDTISTIVNNLTTLNFLKIPYLVDSSPEISIASLKQLHVESIDSRLYLQSLIVNQNNLEVISVKWINDNINDLELMEQITLRLTKLRNATFGAGFKPTYQILKLFKDNCNELHTLNIFYDSIDPIAMHVQNAINGNGLSLFQFKNDSAGLMFSFVKSMWYDADRIFVHISSHPSSDTESMNGADSDDDFDFADSSDDESFENNPFYYFSDSDEMDFYDHMFREAIGFLIN